MKRYSVMVRRPRSEKEVELCQVDANPEKMKAAAQARKIYEHVYIKDNFPPGGHTHG